MHVTLAYPFEGHDPDETIEVDDPVGQDLIRDGRARPADVAAEEPTTTRTKRGKQKEA